MSNYNSKNYDIELFENYNIFNQNLEEICIKLKEFLNIQSKEFIVKSINNSKKIIIIIEDNYGKEILSIYFYYTNINILDSPLVYPPNILFKESYFLNGSKKEYYFNLDLKNYNFKYISESKEKQQINLITNNYYKYIKELFDKINEFINSFELFKSIIINYSDIIQKYRQYYLIHSLYKKYISLNKNKNKKNIYNYNYYENSNNDYYKELLEQNYNNKEKLENIKNLKYNNINEKNINNIKFNNFNNKTKEEDYKIRVYNNLLLILKNFIIDITKELNSNKDFLINKFEELLNITNIQYFYINFQENKDLKDVYINFFIVIKENGKIEFIKISHITIHCNFYYIVGVSPIHFVINNIDKILYNQNKINKYYFNLIESNSEFLFSNISGNEQLEQLDLSKNSKLNIFNEIINFINIIINGNNFYKNIFSQLFYLSMLMKLKYNILTHNNVLKFKSIKYKNNKSNKSEKKSNNLFYQNKTKKRFIQELQKGFKKDINVENENINFSNSLFFSNSNSISSNNSSNSNNNSLKNNRIIEKQIHNKIKEYEKSKGYKSFINRSNYIKPQVSNINNNNNNTTKIIKLRNQLLDFIEIFCNELQELLNSNELEINCYELKDYNSFYVNYKYTTNQNIYINIYLIQIKNEIIKIQLPCHIKFEFNLINFYYKLVYPVHIVINELLCGKIDKRWNKNKNRNYYFNLISIDDKIVFDKQSVGQNQLQIDLDNEKINVFDYIWNYINILINSDNYNEYFRLLYNIIIKIRRKNNQSFSNTASLSSNQSNNKSKNQSSNTSSLSSNNINLGI